MTDQKSLGTRDKSEAKQLLAAMNSALRNMALNLAIAEAYLAARDPKLCERTWQEVFDEYARRGGVSTTQRNEWAIRSAVFTLFAAKNYPLRPGKTFWW